MMVSLVLIHVLDFGNSVLAGLPVYLVLRLQSVLNAAARLTYHLRRSDDATDALVFTPRVADLRGRRSFRSVDRHYCCLWTVPLVRLSALSTTTSFAGCRTTRHLCRPTGLCSLFIGVARNSSWKGSLLLGERKRGTPDP